MYENPIQVTLYTRDQNETDVAAATDVLLYVNQGQMFTSARWKLAEWVPGCPTFDWRFRDGKAIVFYVNG